MNRRTETLHTYRALLRAATYLPDSAVRAYAHEQIVSRFKAIKAKHKSNPDKNELADQQLASARKLARTLERAGNGSMVDLNKVLRLTYGRTGKRKRVLVQDLLGTEERSLPSSDAALKALINNPNGSIPLRFAPDSKFYSFLRSQHQNNPPEAAGSLKIRHLKAQVPKENIWGRPTPVKAKLGLQRRWWASTLNKLLPPVPQHEWNRLRDLASGKIPIEEPPSRRRPGTGSSQVMGSDLELVKFFRTPARINHTGIEGVTFDEDQGLIPKMGNRNGIDDTARREPYNYKRSMRRLYATIWQLTPTMSKDEVTNKWDIQWGGGRTAAQAGLLTTPSASDKELFEGLENLPQKGQDLKKIRMQGYGRTRDQSAQAAIA